MEMEYGNASLGNSIHIPTDNQEALVTDHAT